MDKNKQLEAFPIVFLNFESGCFTLFDGEEDAIRAGETGFKHKGNYFIADVRNTLKLQTKIKQLEAENENLNEAGRRVTKENQRLREALKEIIEFNESEHINVNTRSRKIAREAIKSNQRPRNTNEGKEG